MSWNRLRPNGGWAINTTVAPEEFEAIDSRLVSTIDAVGGGSYSPTQQIVIGGLGIQLTTQANFYSAVIGNTFTWTRQGAIFDEDGTSIGTNDTNFTVNIPAVFDNSLNVTGPVTGTSAAFQSITLPQNGAAFLTAGTSFGTNNGLIIVQLPITSTSTIAATSASFNALSVTGGATNVANINASGNAAVTGNETVGGTLGVTGATTLGSTLTVNNGSLVVSATTGISTLQHTLLLYDKLAFSSRGRVVPRVFFLSTSGNSTVSISDGQIFVMRQTSTAPRVITLKPDDAVVGDMVEFWNFDSANGQVVLDDHGDPVCQVPTGVAVGLGPPDIRPGIARVAWIGDGLTTSKWHWIERVLP